MINYFLSLSILFSNVRKSIFLNRYDYVILKESFNKICYFDVFSLKNIPSFLNSAMDGYALNLFKFKYNFNFISNRFFVIDIVKAGAYLSYYEFDGDYVIEIMTGARVPSNFVSVVKVEDVYFSINNPFEIVINKQLIYGEHIRLIGEDFKFGSFLLKKGKVISCHDIAGLSSFGISEICILKSFKFFLICTGREVVDSFTLDFNKSFINNSLSLYIINFLKELGVSVSYLGLNLDCRKSFKELIRKVVCSNDPVVIISTGAVSKGKADFIPFVLSELKFNILFHGVSIKPGKPILAAIHDKCYFFGLPGNPISSIIGLRFFVYPFIRYITGLPLEAPLKCILENDWISCRKSDLFLKAFTYFSKSIFYVRIVEHQQSFKIKSFIETNSFVFLRVNDSSKEGDILNVYFYKPFDY